MYFFKSVVFRNPFFWLIFYIHFSFLNMNITQAPIVTNKNICWSEPEVILITSEIQSVTKLMSKFLKHFGPSGLFSFTDKKRIIFTHFVLFQNETSFEIPFLSQPSLGNRNFLFQITFVCENVELRKE